MTAALAYQPVTLTDRRQEIYIEPIQRSPEEFASREVLSATPCSMIAIVERPSAAHRLTVEIHMPGTPPLMKALKDCLPMLRLSRGWDGVDAPPIDSATIEAAFKALVAFRSADSSLPQWTPTRNGGVQLDWHENSIDLEIAFEPDAADGYAGLNDNLSGDEWDGFVTERLQELREIFATKLNARR